MVSYSGTAVGYADKAYFSKENNVYSYSIHQNKLTKLPPLQYRYFCLAVINGSLTAIGGMGNTDNQATDALQSFNGSLWGSILPPMPTKRMNAGAAITNTHLVVAGGKRETGLTLSTVEILTVKARQWSTASSLPLQMSSPEIIFCNGYFYLSKNANAFSCSVDDLLKSSKSDSGSLWNQLAGIPSSESSLVTLKGHVLAIGGEDSQNNPRGTIHCYDVATNSWTAIGGILTPRSYALVAVLPSNELVVVGGNFSINWATGEHCSITEIGSCVASHDFTMAI